jgi:phospholipase/carboxylesterase
VPIGIEPYSIEENGWTVRVQPPIDPANARVLLLLHGWTGDEKVMWIFTRALSGHFWLFAPRAPVAVHSGGYAWLPHAGQRWPALEDFRQVTDDLLAAVDGWTEQAKISAASRLQPLELMGFSQGAAMSFALAAFQPQRIGRIAALAGFLPRRTNSASPNDSGVDWTAAFRGRRVYVAHGTRDEIVPISMAHETVRELQAAEADVTYCESDVGHKLSADCLRGIDRFFKD